jgi:uncharacterized surface protein with fasciclin (FAS1) repeats
MPARSTHALAASITAAAFALTIAACGSSTSSTPSGAAGTSQSSHAMTRSHAMKHSHEMAASAPFGMDCGMVPATGTGSFHSMSMDPVVTAAARNPLLSTLARDIKTAGLTTELNSMRTFTLFAPENAAFSKLPASAMAMMHSAAELAKVIKYHVVAGHVTTAELASGKALTSLEGSSLKPAKMGSVYEVGNADVICGNIQTANATVYVINKVLEPMH